MYIAESNVFYSILCLCIVTVVLLLYLAIWATISLNTVHFTSPNDLYGLHQTRICFWKASTLLQSHGSASQHEHTSNKWPTSYSLLISTQSVRA